MENGVERPAVRRAMESGGERRAMENGRPEVRRAMETGGERRAMENGRPEVRRAKENGGERKEMENWDEMEDWDVPMPVLDSELVMCSTCSGFVRRKQRKAILDLSVEVVEAQKMRNLVQAYLRYGPFQDMEPAEATNKQWQILRRRRLIMMETKRCPACWRSLLETCLTCSRSLSEKPAGAGPDEEDKAAGSKEKSSLSEKPAGAGPDEEDKAAGSKEKSSSEEGSELMAVLPSQGGKERKKIATEDEPMLAVKKSKRSRVEGNGSSSGLKKKKKKKKKKAKSEDKEGSGANRSSKMEGNGPKEVETEEGIGSKLARMEVRESAGGNGKKTKMVTRRLDKMTIDIILKDGPRKPYTYDTLNPFLECMFASDTRQYEVDCEFHEYLRRQSMIRGYAEYQVEVTDDEEE